MEQPPGSLDDLQPQDLSTSSIPTVIDLTRKGEECVLNSPSIDALRVAKSPGWFQNSGTGNPGLAFSETGSSDVMLNSGEHIQPDNAFSRTTVTLSYVSRSHVFSTPDSLSRHSTLSVVPPISRFAVHSLCDSDKGLEESGYLLNQHYLEQVEGPVDLAAQPELLHSLSQAQEGPEDGVGIFLTQDLRKFNGGTVSSDGDVENQTQGEEEVESSTSWENCQSLENGQVDSRSSTGACAESSPETLVPVAMEDEEQDSPEVVFLKQDPAVVMDTVAAKDTCSLNREYVSPLEDPVSPSATSLEDIEDEFLLPQASSSPSGDNSYLETAEDAALGGLSTDGAIQLHFDTRLDSSSKNKHQVLKQKVPVELIDLTDDDVLEDKPMTVIPHMNGSVKALQRTLIERKLPVRSGRGMRLEAIVMNINSSKYKVSGCIRTKKKARVSPSTAIDSNVAIPKRNNNRKVGKRKSRARASFSEKTTKQKSVTRVGKKIISVNTDSCKDSTSDSEILSSSLKSHSSTPQITPPFPVRKRPRKEPKDVSHFEHSPEMMPTRSKRKCSSQSSPCCAVNETKPTLVSQPESSTLSPPPPPLPPPSSKSPKKSQGITKDQAAESRTPRTAKTKAKRRHKKPKSRQLSSFMFSPKEPEIKLKYVNYKEEKRELRLDGFSPFIRLERQQSSPSLCTVINYPEEVRTQRKKGQQQSQAHTTDFVPAAVPSTSCLQLGRASTHGQHQRTFVCCLCGQSANAMDLGDLHGPYYPEGYQQNAKTPASTSGLKEDGDYSDSDSSSCTVRRRSRGKHAIPPALRSFRTGGQLKQSHRWSSDGNCSPAAKRARLDASTADVEDWYSAPVLPMEPCEYWLHEDCGIWSAGVFLVKGKVYGLEEAVKAAQETVCSACRDPGASLGCFFKGCPNKYHYRCALESECVLIEDNFSMKCKKHKNKTFKGASGKRWDNR